MSGLVDAFGRPVGRQPLEGKFTESENVYEGILNVTVYDDAIEGKGTCAHCVGPIEGVLRFPPGYKLRGDRDRELDAMRQLEARIKRDHFCISRVQKDKLPVTDWLKRFS